MALKVLARIAVLFAIALAPVAASAQTSGSSGNRPAANRQSAPVPATSNPSLQDQSNSTSGDPGAIGAEGGLHNYQPAPRVTVATPPPTARAWTWQEMVTWGANLVLVVMAYFGIMKGISLLKKIERQTAYAEAAAEAASASAQAALLNAQSFIHSERPWILISIEPSRSMENSFTIMATNRGRTPARIISTTERTRIAIDDRRLPRTPEYKKEEPNAPLVPIILVPGESTPIKSFCRDDVKALCDSEERYKRIETWEEKVFLYGKVIYKDLISPPDDEDHETNWCCWYIHGRQNSGLVIAGTLEYNSHT
ncbi:MAG: hypothetical protein ABR905_03500 [Terracidiphilus sp.]|jgi:hypothetical protein